MRYISARPTRLFCPTCEEIYSLPQGGDIKLYSGAVCPLDSFELVTFILGGRDGKRYALCPFCYNHPPFEDLAQSSDAGKPGVQQIKLPVNDCCTSLLVYVERFILDIQAATSRLLEN